MKTISPHQALWLSVAAALVTIGLKWGAWWATGSVGFLSDALESLVNLAGASFALVMVLYARRPADHGHPYGLNILREGWQLVRRSVDGLMDGALAEEDIRGIEEALGQLKSVGGTFANLRTRGSGANRFAFVELHVPPGWSVERADELAGSAERAVSGQGITLMVRVMPEVTR